MNDLQCLLIKHLNEVMVPPPTAYQFQLNDKILLFGTLGNLRKITQYL